MYGEWICVCGVWICVCGVVCGEIAGLSVCGVWICVYGECEFVCVGSGFVCGVRLDLCVWGVDLCDRSVDLCEWGVWICVGLVRCPATQPLSISCT